MKANERAEWVKKWGWEKECDRLRQRADASPTELARVYEVMQTLFPTLIEEIGDREPGSLSEAEREKLAFLLACVEVSQMVDVFGVEGMGPDAFEEARFQCLM